MSWLKAVGIPGNGKSFTENEIALWVMIIGVAFHLFHTFDMKYADENTTNKNIPRKNNLQSNMDDEKLRCSNHMVWLEYRSKRVMVASPIYFKPCKVVFNRYCWKLSLQHRRIDRLHSVWSWITDCTLLSLLFGVLKCTLGFNIFSYPKSHHSIEFNHSSSETQ